MKKEVNVVANARIGLSRRESRMLKSLAEILEEREDEIVEAYHKGWIALHDNAESLAWAMCTDEIRGNIRVYNLGDWSWALDMRKNYI